MVECIKTPICGSCYTSCDFCGLGCGTEHIIYKSSIQAEKFLSINIINIGECPITIYKDGQVTDIKVVPGCSVSLVLDNIAKLSFKCCKELGISGVCSICWKGCAINKVLCLCDDYCDDYCDDEY
ncbi:MAG: hypothetical protein Q7K36_02770 [Fusobacterium sp. JB020]|nr:hypothetical protein [Fusobacterium sp. JB020]